MMVRRNENYAKSSSEVESGISIASRGAGGSLH